MDDDVGILDDCGLARGHGLKGADAVESFGELSGDATNENGVTDDCNSDSGESVVIFCSGLFSKGAAVVHVCSGVCGVGTPHGTGAVVA